MRAWPSSPGCVMRSRPTASASTRTCRCSHPAGCRSRSTAWRGTSMAAVRALAGAVAALVAQVLSCGYYLLFFAPVSLPTSCSGSPPARMPASAGRGSARAGRRDRSGVHVAVRAAVPRAAGAGVPETAAPRGGRLLRRRAWLPHGPRAQWVWGPWLRVYPKPEGELFPGYRGRAARNVGGCGVEALSRWRAARDLRARDWRRAAERVRLVLVAAAALVLVAGARHRRHFGARVGRPAAGLGPDRCAAAHVAPPPCCWSVSRPRAGSRPRPGFGPRRPGWRSCSSQPRCCRAVPRSGAAGVPSWTRHRTRGCTITSPGSMA